MITSKQRATLRGLANPMDTIIQVGKGGVNDSTIKQVNDALKARELIKIKVLENCELTATEVAQQIAPLVNAEIIQVIGTKFVLYRRNAKKPIIVLE